MIKLEYDQIYGIYVFVLRSKDQVKMINNMPILIDIYENIWEWEERGYWVEYE